jgi:RNA polymerase-binding transcription factor DksA
MKDIKQYKEVLESECKELEKELSSLGVRDPQNPDEWDVKVPEMDIMDADENEVADRSEEMHVDSIILDELTVRYNNIVKALSKIEDGTYGSCEMCGESIEDDRLQANPSALTCKKHMEEGGDSLE